jgi:hypothetical protein
MKTKGAVKNGHSRDTGDIGHTRQRQTNKKYKAQQITENYKDHQKNLKENIDNNVTVIVLGSECTLNS